MCRVLDNQKLVSYLAARYKGKTRLEFQDIFQQGNIGLIKADRTFDESKGVPFSAYAAKYISFEILRGMAQYNDVYTPRKTVELATKIRKAHMEYSSLSELIEFTGATEARIANALYFLDLQVDYNLDNAEKAITEPDFYRSYVDYLLSKVKENYANAIRLVMLGYTVDDLQQVLCMGKRQVDTLLYNARKQLKIVLKKEEESCV